VNLAQLEFCRTLGGEALLATDLPADPLAAVQTLRRECDAQQVAAILELREVRQRAARSGRVPPAWAGRLLATKTMLAQASSIRVARYVGGQLAAAAAAAGGDVLDLCCGMGMDAIGVALTAAAGMAVRGYDISAEAVFCAAHNAEVAGVGGRCDFFLGDATAVELDGRIVHVDPDRRADGRRHLSIAGYSPGEEFLRELPQRAAAGAIKLSPAVDRRALAHWPAVRLEYISEDGACKQLVAWWGAAGPNAARQATIVWGDWQAPQTFSLAGGIAAPAAVGEVGQYILEPDPAIIAAGAVDDLAASLGAGGRRVWRLSATLDWLTADQPADSPAIRNFRILREVPGRKRDVATALRELGAGTVEIKPRGVRLDTDTLQRELSGRGERPLVVLWCRLGASQRAFIAERADGSDRAG
jgi:SAM-dependent methyltransferase